MAMRVPPPDVGVGEPPHELRERVVGAATGEQDQMPVVGHDAPAQNVDGPHQEPGPGQQADKRGVIRIVLKQPAAVVSAIQNVITIPPEVECAIRGESRKRKRRSGDL